MKIKKKFAIPAFTHAHNELHFKTPIYGTDMFNDDNIIIQHWVSFFF